MHISQANQRTAPSHSQHQHPAELLAPLPTYAHQGSLLLSSTTCFLRVELELASTPPQFSNDRVYATHRENLDTERVHARKVLALGERLYTKKVYTWGGLHMGRAYPWRPSLQPSTMDQASMLV